MLFKICSFTYYFLHHFMYLYEILLFRYMCTAADNALQKIISKLFMINLLKSRDKTYKANAHCQKNVLFTTVLLLFCLNEYLTLTKFQLLRVVLRIVPKNNHWTSCCKQIWYLILFFLQQT